MNKESRIDSRIESLCLFLVGAGLMALFFYVTIYEPDGFGWDDWWMLQVCVISGWVMERALGAHRSRP